MNDLYGTYIVNRDDVNRITIPAQAKPEVNEKFILYEYGDEYCLYTEKGFSKVLDKLEQKIDNCIDEEKVKELKYKYKLFLIGAKKNLTCDRTHRVIIGDILAGEKELYLVGDRQRILIITNSQYNSLLEEKKQLL